MRNQRGFTLVELLLVVAILAILGLLAIPRIVEAVETSRERVCESNVRMLEEAVNRFHADQIAKGINEPENWPWWEHAFSGDVMCQDGSWNGSCVRDSFMLSFGEAPRCPYGGGYHLEWVIQDGYVAWRVWCDGRPEGQEMHSVRLGQ